MIFLRQTTADKARRLQAFVSSTFKDLQKEREAVAKALASDGYLVAGMELFPATSGKPLEHIYKTIEESDVYIVITAGRYGSLIGGKSATEQEHDYAELIGKPILAFVHADLTTLPAGSVQPAFFPQLKVFNEKLSERLYKTWHTSQDLCLAVTTSVNHWKRNTDLRQKGWLRAKHVESSRLAQKLWQSFIALLVALALFALPFIASVHTNFKNDQIPKSFVVSATPTEQYLNWSSPGRFYVFVEYPRSYLMTPDVNLDRNQFNSANANCYADIDTDVNGATNEYPSGVQIRFSGQSVDLKNCSPLIIHASISKYVSFPEYLLLSIRRLIRF